MISYLVDPQWYGILQPEFDKSYMAELERFLSRETEAVYPPRELVFNAFNLTPFDRVRVVIVGQDPYHGAMQAEGLAFSVPEGVQKPPSLLNVFKEVQSDIGTAIPRSGSLVRWARQGVFLLNTTLTVRANEPLSHKGRGWERFTSAVIEKLNERADPLIFLLWGRHAQETGIHIRSPHKVLVAPHPSPLSAHRGFFGCRHFSAVNSFLRAASRDPILW